jgi:hypothetical protein
MMLAILTALSNGSFAPSQAGMMLAMLPEDDAEQFGVNVKVGL